MRWKLVVLSSVIAAVAGVGIWSVLIKLLFGSERKFVNAYNDAALFASMLIPLAMALFAGVFVYRHTARRRRLQAILTVLFSIVLIPVAYGVATRLFIP